MSGIRVELQLVDGSFATGMLRAGQSVSSFYKELARIDPHFKNIEASGKRVVNTVRKVDVVHRDLLSTMRDISVVSGAVIMSFRGITGASGGILGSITKVNAEIERLKYQMLGMSVSAEPMREAAASVEYLRQKALQAPFSLNELANSFVKLKATGTDPMGGSLRAVADGIAAFGGTDEHLHRVTLGIVQMSGKSVIQMEEMRQQLGESMPNAMRIMARSMGVSVAELTKAISTGRVEAGAALNAFYAELERTYGGEAQRMMETFSGQVSQLRANLQILATGDGMKGFFEEQKAGLMELNAFLQSPDAQKFAKDVGNALTAMVRGIRIGVRAVYDFRQEIALIAQVIAGGMAIKVMTSGVLKLSTAVNLARLSMGAFAGQIATGASMMRLGAQGLITMQSATTASALAFTGLRTAVVGFGGAVMVAAPWLAAIGATLAIVGSKMGWFGGQTDEAYENLKKFGAESERQAKSVLAHREAELVAERNKLRSEYNRQVDRRSSGNISNATIQLLNEAEERLRNFQKEKERILSDASEKDIEKDVRAYDQALQTKLRLHNETYRQRQVQIDRERDLELSKTSETGKKSYEITEEFQKKTLDNRITRQRKILETIDSEIDRIKDLQNASTTETQRNNFGRLIDFLNGKRVESAKIMRDIDKFGISFVADIENEESKIKRGSKLLDGLQSKIKGLQSDLVGAGSAYAKLQFEISRGDYGDLEQGGEAVRMLHEGLREAVAQKEALDVLMKGDRRAERDADALISRAIERRQEAIESLSGEEMSESQKFLLRLNNGFYEGLGPLDNITSDIQKVGQTMRDSAFGPQTVDRIDTVNRALENTLSLVTGLRSGAGGIQLEFGSNKPISPMSGAMKSSAAHILQLLAQEGVTGNAAAGIAGNFKVESAFNTGALGDNGTSFGLAQWHKQRWQGLKAFSGDLDMDEADPRAQIKFLMHELQKDYPDLLARMNMAANPAEAASMFMREFERPHKDHANEAGRRAAAMEIGGMRPGGINPNAGAIPTLPFNPTSMIENRQTRTNDLRQKASEAAKIEAEALAYEEHAARKAALEKLIAEKAGAGFEIDGQGKNYAKMIEAIQTGNLGRNRDIDADVYKEILDAAKELDAIEARRAEKKKAERQSTEQLKSLERERAEIAARIAEEQGRIKDPNFQGQSSDLRKLINDLDIYVERVRTAFGTESVEFRAAQDYRTQLLGEQRLLDVTARQVALSDETRSLRESLMTQSQLRDAQLRKDMARIDTWIADARAAGMSEVEIVRQSEEMKKAVRDKYHTETNPVVQQMKDWKDYSGEMQKKTSSWMDSLSSGVAGLVTGTGDLQGAINGILNDVVTGQVRSLWSNMAGDKTANAASKVGGKGKSVPHGPAGKGKQFPIAHTGAIVGGNMRSTIAHPGVFAGAPRLKKNEVPVIAKKGEGIFTEEQMAALAPVGSQMRGVTINAPISVSGSAGTPEQNQDLAKKMSRELEVSMRGVVVDELRRQMRPGNMIGRK